MNVLEKITHLLLSKEQEDFYKYVGGYLIGLFIACSIIVGYYFSAASGLKTSLNSLYKTQQESRHLLEKVKVIEKQKDSVDTLLDTEKNFKIKNYFDELVRTLNLAPHQRKEAEVTEEEILKNQYSEIKLSAQLYGISMKQLCQLLETLEKKERLYTKDLAITKGRGPTIDISITIGTLKQVAAKD